MFFQLKRFYDQSMEYFHTINLNFRYDNNMNEKDKLISLNQELIETHSKKDEKDINSKINWEFEFFL